jgi:hypothetical protein
MMRLVTSGNRHWGLVSRLAQVRAPTELDGSFGFWGGDADEVLLIALVAGGQLPSV